MDTLERVTDEIKITECMPATLERETDEYNTITDENNTVMMDTSERVTDETNTTEWMPANPRGRQKTSKQ